MLAAKLDGERLGGVTRAAAGVAGDPDIGQEVHLDPFLTGPLAGLAAAAGLVEAESAGRIAAYLGLGKLGEQLADQVEHAGIGARRRCRRLPSGVWSTLITLSMLFESFDGIVRAGRRLGAMQAAWRRLSQDILNERAFARAADARHDGDHAKRERRIHILEIMCAAPADDQRGRLLGSTGRRLVGTGIAARPLR